jgi:hypothetical protein
MTSPNSENFIPSYEGFSKIESEDVNTNPALNTNFRFILHKIPGVTYFCTSVTTPASNSNPLVLDYITATPLKIPGGKVSTDVSIRFIIDENFKNYIEMVRWFRSGVPYRDFREKLPDKLAEPSDAQLLLLNNKKNPIYMINYRNLVPTNLSGFTLSNSEAEPAVLTATVSFVYDTSTMINL